MSNWFLRVFASILVALPLLGFAPASPPTSVEDAIAVGEEEASSEEAFLDLVERLVTQFILGRVAANLDQIPPEARGDVREPFKALCSLPRPLWPDLCPQPDGYIMLSSFGGLKVGDEFHEAILVDREGHVVNSWNVGGYPAQMLPGGEVVAFREDSPLRTSQDERRTVLRVSYDGNILWQFDGEGLEEVLCADHEQCQVQLDPDVRSARVHHDLEQRGFGVYYAPGQSEDTPRDTILVLAHRNVFDPEISPNVPVEDDVIYEITTDSDGDKRITWMWASTGPNRLDDLGFDAVAREAIALWDVAPTGTQPDYPADDWLHINTASYVGPNRWCRAPPSDCEHPEFHPDNVIFNSRQANIIGIIERATGRIVWRIGPDFGPGTSDFELGQIVGPHDGHLIPEGLPGAGNFLLFDNGFFAGYDTVLGLPVPVAEFRLYSRVLEIDPVTKKLLWSYTQRFAIGDRYKFLSFLTSSAQRLPNGNTFICEGLTGRVFEVNRAGVIVWEYISPFQDRFFSPGELPFPGVTHTNFLYRARWVPKAWIPADSY